MPKKSQPPSTEQVLEQIKTLNLQGLLSASKLTLQLIAEQEKEAENKLTLIKNGGK